MWCTDCSNLDLSTNKYLLERGSIRVVRVDQGTSLSPHLGLKLLQLVKLAREAVNEELAWTLGALGT